MLPDGMQLQICGFCFSAIIGQTNIQRDERVHRKTGATFEFQLFDLVIIFQPSSSCILPVTSMDGMDLIGLSGKFEFSTRNFRSHNFV